MNSSKLEKFFEEVLNHEHNQTPSHRTDLPMKKNQSLEYMVDADKQEYLINDLIEASTKYPFIEIFNMDAAHLKIWQEFFHVNKPIAFQLKINNFKNLRYDYDETGGITYMNFDYKNESFHLQIEKIKRV